MGDLSESLKTLGEAAYIVHKGPMELRSDQHGPLYSLCDRRTFEHSAPYILKEIAFAATLSGYGASVQGN